MYDISADPYHSILLLWQNSSYIKFTFMQLVSKLLVKISNITVKTDGKMIKNNLKIVAILITLVSLSVLASGKGSPVASPEVPQSNDLASLGQDARNNKLPVLLVFSAEHCTYCQLLEDEILKPMLLSGDYTNKVLINKIMLDGEEDIRDFNGDAVNASILAQRYNVYVTPTILFLDSNGRELEERLIGINTIEMFGGLVDHAIDTSLKKLNKTKQQVAIKQPVKMP